MLKWSTYHNITQASHPHLLPTIHFKREKQKTNNCLPLSYLKKAIAEITRWKWIYITIPAPSAEVAITNTRRKVDHVLLHSGLHVYSFKTT